MSVSRESRKKSGSTQKGCAEPGKRYSAAQLLKSGVLKGYQRDFARVILKEEAYTVEGARNALDTVLKGGQ